MACPGPAVLRSLTGASPYIPDGTRPRPTSDLLSPAAGGPAQAFTLAKPPLPAGLSSQPFPGGRPHSLAEPVLPRLSHSASWTLSHRPSNSSSVCPHFLHQKVRAVRGQHVCCFISGTWRRVCRAACCTHDVLLDDQVGEHFPKDVENIQLVPTVTTPLR